MTPTLRECVNTANQAMSLWESVFMENEAEAIRECINLAESYLHIADKIPSYKGIKVKEHAIYNQAKHEVILAIMKKLGKLPTEKDIFDVINKEGTYTPNRFGIYKLEIYPEILAKKIYDKTTVAIRKEFER